MSNMRAQTTFTAVDKFSARVRLMRKNTSRFAQKTQANVARVNRAFTKLMSPLSRLNRMLGGLGVMIGGAALVGVIGGAIRTFADFEQANANVASVLGTTSKHTKALQEDAKRLGATTSFTATQVAELQKEYAKLGFNQSEIINSTEATLNLARATDTELAQAAKQTGSTLRAFGLTSEESGRVAGVLGVATTKAALDMEFFATAMSKVAPISKTAGFSLEETAALFASLADSGFDASTAATSTKNILLMAADSGSELAKAMGGPVTSMEDLVKGFGRVSDSGADLTKMLNLTDKRSVAAFATFIDGRDKMLDFANAMDSPEAKLQAMADAMSDTLQGSVIKLSSAYDGLILSLEDGNGAFSGFIRTTIDATTELLTMLSGTAKSESELTKKEKRIRSIAQTMLKWIKIIGVVIGSLIAIKVATMVVMGAIALYKGVLGVVTAAQWLWNKAMAANPIGLIIVGIIALIAVIVAIIYYWEEWGAVAWAALSLIIAPIGLIISLLIEVWKRWGNITDAFQNGGILSGLLMIGKTILSAVIMPIEQLLKMIGKIPGMGFAAEAAISMRQFREGMFASEQPSQIPERPLILNNRADESRNIIDRITTNNARVDLNVNDPNNRVSAESNSDFVTIRREPSFAM